MGETSGLSALPVPSDGVHRILGQRLGSDSFTELGWTVLRNDPLDGRAPVIDADFVLAEPQQGLVLVQVASTTGRGAVDQLRRRLDEAGFGKAAPGFLPIVTLQVTDADVWRLTGLLDFALANEPPIEVQGDWVPLVQQALLAAPAVTPVTAPVPASFSALPLPAERQRLAPASVAQPPGRFRVLHLFWGLAVLAAGAAFGLLNYLGPPRPESIIEANVEQAAPPSEPTTTSPVARVPAAQAPAAQPPVTQTRPEPVPERPVEEVASVEEVPLPPPPAPPRPATQARVAPDPWTRPAPDSLARPAPDPWSRPTAEPSSRASPDGWARSVPEQPAAAEPELPPGWYVAKPPELDRDWSSGNEAGRPEPVESAGPARVVLHYHRSRRDLAESLAGRAYRLGGTVETRVVPATPAIGEIRYFNAGDRETAERLAETLGGNYRTRSFTNFSPRPRRGTLEVWIPGRADDWD